MVCQADGSGLTQKVVRGIVERVARRAKLAHDGVHVLRHTFCSHLAMRGLPPITIKEWAGHRDLKTTMRYMHLSPKLGPSALRCLEDAPPEWWRRGVVETDTAQAVEK